MHLEWRVAGLKTLFENSKGESKSKCVKSALFDSHRWQIFFYPNSGNHFPPHSLTFPLNTLSIAGHEQYSSIYLSCEPTADEKEKGAAEALRGNSTNTQFGTDPLKSTPISTGHAGSGSSSHIKPTTEGKTPWRRDGKFKFTFEARSLDRRMTFKQMEATDHSFSDTARNWGYQNFWKRSDAWFNNRELRTFHSALLRLTVSLLQLLFERMSVSSPSVYPNRLIRDSEFVKLTSCVDTGCLPADLHHHLLPHRSLPSTTSLPPAHSERSRPRIRKSLRRSDLFRRRIPYPAHWRTVRWNGRERETIVCFEEDSQRSLRIFRYQ